MSYCGPQWMSLYQHNRLINHARLDPEWVGDEPIWADKLEYREYFAPRDLPYPPPDQWKHLDMRINPIISITGVVRSAEEVEVMTVARVEAAGGPPGDPTALTAELVDDEGRVVARGTVIRLHSHGDCGCDQDAECDPATPYPFQAYIPNVERGAALRIVDGDRTMWERRATDRPPKVDRFEAEPTSDGRLRVAWDADIDRQEAEVWLQWSADRGQTWRGLATGIHDRESTVDLAGVPNGAIQVRLLVHDGFDTTVTRRVAVRVPVRPSEVVILSPSDGDMLITGRPMRLWALASSPDGTPLDEESGRWSIDNKEVGQGFEAWVDAPRPGEHRATFAIDRRSRATVTFRTIDPEADLRSQSK